MNLPVMLSESLHLEENKLTIYLAGKVSGLPYPVVYAKFRAKQLELEALGHQVLNPCEIIPEDAPWREAMRTAIMLLCTSDYICLLPCWKTSKGARLERFLARILNIPNIDR